MTTFLDGPAAGQRLMLKRAPELLRVVEHDGTFDALDQLDDKPEPEETLYAYRKSSDHGTMHINRGRNGSGFYAMAEYKFIAQPEDAIMRDTTKWQDWCRTTITGG